MSERLFIAIPIHAPLLAARAAGWQRIGGLETTRLNWVDPGNWHITLFFLGDTPVSQIDPIRQQVDESFSGVNSFRTSLTKPGLFPSGRDPKVLWAGLSNLDPLLPAREELGKRLTGLGLSFDRKPLKPHLTLARTRSNSDLSALISLVNSQQTAAFDVVEISQVVLFKSTLTQKGPVYQALHTTKISG